MYHDFNDDTLHRYAATVAARKRGMPKPLPAPRRPVWNTIRDWTTACRVYVERKAPPRRRGV